MPSYAMVLLRRYSKEALGLPRSNEAPVEYFVLRVRSPPPPGRPMTPRTPVRARTDRPRLPKDETDYAVCGISEWNDMFGGGSVVFKNKDTDGTRPDASHTPPHLPQTLTTPATPTLHPHLADVLLDFDSTNATQVLPGSYIQSCEMDIFSCNAREPQRSVCSDHRMPTRMQR